MTGQSGFDNSYDLPRKRDQTNTMSATAIPPLRLSRGEDRRIGAGHMWVFSNEVDIQATPLVQFAPGSLCRVVSDKDKFLAYAYVNPRSLICARVLSRDVNNPPTSPFLERLLEHRLRVALALRARLYERPFYRWVYGESDALPGLVLDRFGDVLVGQIGTAGIEAMRPAVEEAIRKVLPECALLWKNDGGMRELEGLPSYVEVAFGSVPQDLAVVENGVEFSLSATHGQKTGWFYDHAGNRRSMLKYVKGARVLDVFSYVGAWGLSAARAGASEVLCVDSSSAALQRLQDIAAANALQVSVRQADAFDALEALHAEKRTFDVVVVDPPAFIKRKKDMPKGEAAYKRLNQLAMQVLDKDGILISCSCSHHLSADALQSAIQKAARTINRFAQIIEVGGHAADHPIHPAIRETAYLKAFFCRVVRE
jgi:23S rRNA (cytosine1962-C5)-methyltransferase